MAFHAFLLAEEHWKHPILSHGLTSPSHIYYYDIGPLLSVLKQRGVDHGQLASVEVTAFRIIAAWIESCVRETGDESALRNSVCIAALDPDVAVRVDELNPIRIGAGWPKVVAMLVLAFPEIHWIFCQRSVDNGGGLFEEAHFLRSGSNSQEELKRAIDLLRGGFTALFDPTGLRSRIRNNAVSLKEGADYVPIRKKVAATVDDELAYCYFNAYAAYRFGYRSHVVNSHCMLAALFKDGRERVDISFEDLFLRFPDVDAKPDTRMSELEERDKEFSGFLNVAHRILVTVGHHNTRAQRQYLSELKLRPGATLQTFGFVWKPFSGLFNLWKETGLGPADGFVWPPPRSEPDWIGGHSAPGLLHEIADRLAARAKRILSAAVSVPDAIHAAVLATDAAEYLGLKAPTTALEAIAIKHEAEVIAECGFFGVESGIDVKNRIVDLNGELAAVARWFHSETREASADTAKVGILNRIVQRFREHNQFDEELVCLAEIRRLNRRLWRFKRPGVIGWVATLLRWYVDTLLASFRNLAIAVGAWILVFSVFYHVLGKEHDPDKNGVVIDPDADILSALLHAVYAFIGMGPPHDKLVFWEAPVTISAIVLGAVHLGLLVSYLFSIVFRR